MSEEQGKIIPNTHQTPNALVDEYMRYLDGDEVKCYLAVTRKTLGWMKRSDRISTSQLEIVTGLSGKRIAACMTSLVSYGLVMRVAENDPRKNHGVEWALQMDDTKINVAAMTQRADLQQKQNEERAAKARAKKVAGGMVVAQPYVVAQPGGGVVAQPTQKPLSKGLTTATTADAQKKEVSAEPALPKPNIFRDYEQNFGALTPMIADELRDFEKTYPLDWIEYAMREAVTSNARNVKYVASILKRIQQHGFDSPKPTTGKGQALPARQKYPTKQTQSQAEAALAAFVQEG